MTTWACGRRVALEQHVLCSPLHPHGEGQAPPLHAHPLARAASTPRPTSTSGMSSPRAATSVAMSRGICRGSRDPRAGGGLGVGEGPSKRAGGDQQHPSRCPIYLGQRRCVALMRSTGVKQCPPLQACVCSWSAAGCPSAAGPSLPPFPPPPPLPCDPLHCKAMSKCCGTSSST